MKKLAKRSDSKLGRFHPAVVAAAAALGMGAASAHAAEPSREDMLAEVQRLQERIDRLSARTDAADAQANAVEVDAAVDAVLADADRRSQLLGAGGFTAGWSKGKFLLQSEDGSFVLNPNIHFQLRYIVNHADGADADGDDVTQSGLEIRRLKLSFDGNAFGPNLAYKFQWQVNRNTGATTLEDAWVRYKFADQWSVRAGQFIEPLFHEQLTSSKRLLAVDRSLLNETLGTGGESYVQGVSLIYDDGQNLRGELAYHDGVQSVNTSFVDGGGTALLGIVAPDFGVAGRVEYKVSGDWKQYDDMTAMGNTASLLVVGAGADYTEAGDTYALFHTVDVQWEPQAVPGLGVYAAYVGVARDMGEVPGQDASPYDWGFLAQAGYALNDKWEVFGRYDYVNVDDDAPGGLNTAAAAAGSDDLHEITVGVNYFIKAHAAKITVDGTWLPNGSPVGTGVDIVGQGNDDDQFVLRAQFQLLL